MAASPQGRPVSLGLSGTRRSPGADMLGELATEKVLKYLQDTLAWTALSSSSSAAGWQPSVVGLQGVGTPGPGERALNAPQAHAKLKSAGDTVLSSFATEFSRKSSPVTRRLTSPFPLCPKCKIITTATTVFKGEGNKHSEVTSEPREPTPWPGLPAAEPVEAGTREGGRLGVHWGEGSSLPPAAPAGAQFPGLTCHAQEQIRKCRVSCFASSAKFHG